MATATRHARLNEGITAKEMGGRAAGDSAPTSVRITTKQVWRDVEKASFAVLAYVTPAGEPRSSGVVYKAVGHRLFMTTAPDSWKARHISPTRKVSVTVPVRRGGLLSLVVPIPPATINFRGKAIVHPAGSPQGRSAIKELGKSVPPERRENASVIEVIPEGMFLTYAVRVPLRKMLDLAGAHARVPVE